MSWRQSAALASACAALLACSAPDQAGADAGLGASYVKTPISVCPQIIEFSASPLAVALGDAIDLTSNAEADNAELPLAYYWISTSGKFRDATAARTRYTCTERGEHLLQLVVSDGTCADYRQLPVTCVNNWAIDSVPGEPSL